MLDEFTRAQRRRFLGSSDAAAIIGRDAWGRTAGDVFAEKTGRVVDQPSSMVMTLGHYLEPAILSWTEAQLDTTIVRDLFLIHSGGILAANLDGAALIAPEPAIIEAKSAGLIGRPAYLEEFGEPGSDEVPIHVLIQVHHQFAVVEDSPDLPRIEVALVPALLIGRGFVLYRIQKNADLCAALIEDEERFWHDHVEKNVPPPDAPSMRTLKRLQRAPEPSVEIPTELVEAWQVAAAERKRMAATEEETLRALIAALGDVEVGTCPLGMFTYKQQIRKAYTVAETTFRVPRFQKPPKETHGRRTRS